MAAKTLCTSCGCKAIIYTSKKLSLGFSQCYCRCTNEICLKTFVMDYTYSHDITPPKSEIMSAVDEILANMGGKERAQLIAKYQQHPPTQ